MIEITDSIRTGLRRLKSKTALQLIALFTLLGVVNEAVSGALNKNLASTASLQASQMTSPLAVSMPLPLAVFAGLGLGVASLVLGIATIRTFYGGTPDGIRKQDFTDNILSLGFNLVVGSFVLGVLLTVAAIPSGIALAVGFASSLLGSLAQSSGIVLVGAAVLASLIFGIIPLYLGTALVLWTYQLVTKETGFIQAMKQTWSMTSRDESQSIMESPRLRIFAVIAVTTLGVQTVSILLTAPLEFTSVVPDVLASVWGVIVGSSAGVASTSVLTALYEELESQQED